LRGSIAISETRPPITAGPIERAFRFLKSTSVSCGALGKGGGVKEEDKSGDAAGDAIGDAPLTGERPGGVSSWAGKIETAQIKRSEAQKPESRTVMAAYSNE
jgi:hypothetical protein